MIAAVLLGDAPWSHRLVLAGALTWPLPTLAVLVALAYRSIRRDTGRPAMGAEASKLLEVLASLQSGHTLRTALASISPDVDRLVRVGASTDDLARAVGTALGELAPTAAVAVRLLDRAGGQAAPVVGELAAQATESVRIRRELRAAVAAPVLQGVLVGGAPLVALGWLIASGNFADRLTASPAHAASVLAGSVMTVTGAVWVAAIIRKALP